MKNKKDEISCEVNNVHGVLSDNGVGTKKVYANISWNGREPKDEIRVIKIDQDGKERVGKGIALSDEEMENLMSAYKGKKDIEEKHKPVDFSKIFDDAPDIIDRREDGHVTKDGFIVLVETDRKQQAIRDQKAKT